MKTSNEPIKSKEEAEQIFNNLVKIAMDTEGISRDQAEKRITALLKSGILEGGNPDDPKTIIMIDVFMGTEI